MSLCLHQNTSAGAGFRHSLAGWARAGIRNVELSDTLLDEFLQSDSLVAARSVITDLGLTPVSCAAVLPDFWLPGPGHALAVDTWKRRCEQFSSLGIDRIYCPEITSRQVSDDDYRLALGCIRQAGDIAQQFRMIAMLEFVRSSTFISTLPTALQLIRAAGHPNVLPLFDCYHFCAGLSKFEDLELLHSGEVGHVHFQDVPDGPREQLDNRTRSIPGEGVAPLVEVLRQLTAKGYSGALSVELFQPEFTQADPYELACRIREKAEAVMGLAGVL